jgi:hypothetical protein
VRTEYKKVPAKSIGVVLFTNPGRRRHSAGLHPGRDRRRLAALGPQSRMWREPLGLERLSATRLACDEERELRAALRAEPAGQQAVRARNQVETRLLVLVVVRLLVQATWLQPGCQMWREPSGLERLSATRLSAVLGGAAGFRAPANGRSGVALPLRCPQGRRCRRRGTRAPCRPLRRASRPASRRAGPFR